MKNNCFFDVQKREIKSIMKSFMPRCWDAVLLLWWFC